MPSDKQQTKIILRQLAHNVATCAAAIQALEKYARSVAWDQQELRLLREEAKGHLRVVFEPLFDSIEHLEDER